MKHSDISSRCFRVLNSYTLPIYKDDLQQWKSILKFRNRRLYSFDYYVNREFRDVSFRDTLEYNKKFKEKYGIRVHDNTRCFIYNLL